MVNELNYKNLFLINAPAGSGKTTTIKKMIDQLLSEDKETSILGITYTNRAVEQLIQGIDSDNVQIKTIHSFISSFMKPYFSCDEVVNTYFEIYKQQILEKIKNETVNNEYIGSAINYVEEYGQLDYETIRKNINKITYNEIEYNSLYYGKLGHDDLLKFSRIIAEKYPIIRKKISSRYKHVFIDEYQDTSADVLKFFYDALKGTETKLYLFGDRMQQIYKNYDGSFENEFKEFDTTYKLRRNYRSSGKIVDVLNNIYNNEKFNQEYYKDNCLKSFEKPKIIICNDLSFQAKKIGECSPNALKLYIANKKRFKDAGIDLLYTSISNMGKYGYGKRFGEIDVLTKDRVENPDVLFRLLFSLNEMVENYLKKNYGAVIQLIKFKEQQKKEEFFNTDILLIHYHHDKIKLANKIKNIVNFYSYESNKTIFDYLSMTIKEQVVNERYVKEILEDSEYKEVLEVPFKEVISLCNYLKDPHVSTQHGVKGEGHNEVYFICEDNLTLGVRMYDFFKLWTQTQIEFQSIQEFFYVFSGKIIELEKSIGIKIMKMKSETYKSNKGIIRYAINQLDEALGLNNYYCNLYKNNFNEFIKNDNLKNAQACLNSNKIKGVLTAYKLFYVGCSRAKEKLTILVDNNKILEYKQAFVEKFENIGFDIEDIAYSENIN